MSLPITRAFASGGSNLEPREVMQVIDRILQRMQEITSEIARIRLRIGEIGEDRFYFSSFETGLGFLCLSPVCLIPFCTVSTAHYVAMQIIFPLSCALSVGTGCFLMDRGREGVLELARERIDLEDRYSELLRDLAFERGLLARALGANPMLSLGN